MELLKDKQATAFDALKAEQGYTNVMQTPKITKVVVSVGTGKETDKNKIKLIAERLETITGQKAASRAAKVSVAAFKLREGDAVGYQVTMRGQRATDFVNKLVGSALPRTKDFRGIPVTAIDEMGNYTLGIKEHTIFPEVVDEEITNIFGMGITIVTTAKNKDEAKAYLTHIGLPFKKEE